MHTACGKLLFGSQNTGNQSCRRFQVLNLEILGTPLGQYSHMTRVKAVEFLFIAGQVGIKPRRRQGGRRF